MAELLVGRRGAGGPPTSMAAVAKRIRKSDRWKVVGGLGVVTAYTIAIAYAVVVGWVLWYLAKALSAGFSGFDAATAGLTFRVFSLISQAMVVWTVIGNLIVGSIIYAGVTAGIERAVTIMMPLMFSFRGFKHLQLLRGRFHRDARVVVYTRFQQGERRHAFSRQLDRLSSLSVSGWGG